MREAPGSKEGVPTPKTSDVRKWARDSGLVTADRGRLPRRMLDAYAAAHTEPTGETATRRRRSAPRSAAEPDQVTPSAKRSAGGRDKRAGTSTSKVATPASAVEQRLQALETQLADALARISALESRSTKSLLGLRTTL